MHTVLSPCTELGEMTPRAIVKTAVMRGLDVIAVCDHNSVRNVSATIKAAKTTSLKVIPGVEITSAEEVHIVGLFPDEAAATAAQEEIYSRLPGKNDEEVFGYQVVVDEDDFVEDLDQHLLVGATTLSTERVVELIHSLQGLAIASHVDRKGFGIFSQLGFIPPGLGLDALEVSRRSDVDALRKMWPDAANYPLITASDAHYLSDIGSAWTVARMYEPSLEELRMALRGQEERCITALCRAPMDH
ncbi:MAG: PHP-associated domain-containing protein [Desulfomonilaceae bacterium]